MQANAHLHIHDHDHEALEKKEQVQNWLKVGVLIGLGLYFVYNILSGNLAYYINARFVWLSYLAAALFLVIGAYSAWTLLQKRKDSSLEEAHHHDHDHNLMSWKALLLVAMPLLLGTLVPAQPLGVDAVDGSITTNSAAAGTSMSTFMVSPEQRNVLDWLRAFNSSDDMTSLNGLPANVIGFIYTEPNFAEDHFMVARFTVSCCVADASAIGLPVMFAQTEEIPQGTWVQVRGTMQVGQFREDTMPILHAETVEVIDQPDHPYLYP